MKNTIDNSNRMIWNNLRNTELADLEYVNDTCFISHSVKDMKNILGKLEIEAAKLELKINVNKRREMRIDIKDDQGKLFINQQQIKQVGG